MTAWTAQTLASHVGIGHWADNPDCVAWMDTAEKVCGKPRVEGFLCRRHHTVAVKRAEAAALKAAVEKLAALKRRERMLPKWRAELARIEARMAVLDPPPLTTDRAAYAGAQHAAVTRHQRRALSDARVAEMAALVARAEQLRRKIGDDR